MKKNQITQTGGIPSKFAPKIGASVGKNDYGKSTSNKHYEKCVKLYEKGGAGAVYNYAELNGLHDYSYCKPCEAQTPTVEGICLVCGSPKS